MPKIMYMDKKYSGSSFGNLEEYSEDILYEPLSAPVLIDKWAEPLDLGILKEDLADYQFLECNFSGDSQNPCPNIINVSSLMYKDYMLVNLTAENNINAHAFYLHFVDNSLNVYISTGVSGYIWYVKGIKIGNSNIIPNPEASYTDTLSKLQINDKVYNLAATAVHYSIDEQVIGTWIDGKPLYEKTYTWSGSLSNNNYVVLDADIKPTNYLVHNQTLMFKVSGANNRFISNALSNSYTLCIASNEGDGLYAENRTGQIITDIVTTVRYTKTTD